jgi:DNA-binding CsgD family transcriptional regulator
LDPNEIEALRLFANGKTADEMAVALGVSKSMSQHYLRVAARKLGARNRVHAVAIAVRMGLVTPSRGAAAAGEAGPVEGSNSGNDDANG